MTESNVGFQVAGPDLFKAHDAVKSAVMAFETGQVIAAADCWARAAFWAERAAKAAAANAAYAADMADEVAEINRSP